MSTDLENLYTDYLNRTPTAIGFPKATQLAYSDVCAHLPVLRYLASTLWRVTEVGVRDGHSTLAFLLGCPGEVISVDCDRSWFVAYLHQRREQWPTNWAFIQGDSTDPKLPIGETDFLFLDGGHCYDVCKTELAFHGRKARRFIGWHDVAVESCWVRDKSGPDPNAKGMGPAIEEWLAQYPGEYKVWYRTEHCNGLLILERVVPKFRPQVLDSFLYDWTRS